MNQMPSTAAQGLLPSPLATKLQGLMRKMNPISANAISLPDEVFPVLKSDENGARNADKASPAHSPAAPAKRVKSRQREDLEKDVAELMLNLGLDPSAAEKPPQWLPVPPVSSPAAAKIPLAGVNAVALSSLVVEGAEAAKGTSTKASPELAPQGDLSRAAKSSPQAPKAAHAPALAAGAKPPEAEVASAAGAQLLLPPSSLPTTQMLPERASLSPAASPKSPRSEARPVDLQPVHAEAAVLAKSGHAVVTMSSPALSPSSVMGAPLRQDLPRTTKPEPESRPQHQEPASTKIAVPGAEKLSMNSATAKPEQKFLASLSDSDLQEMRGLLLQMKEVVTSSFNDKSPPVSRLAPPVRTSIPSSEMPGELAPKDKTPQLIPSFAERPQSRLMTNSIEGNLRHRPEGMSTQESRLATARDVFAPTRQSSSTEASTPVKPMHQQGRKNTQESLPLHLSASVAQIHTLQTLARSETLGRSQVAAAKNDSVKSEVMKTELGMNHLRALEAGKTESPKIGTPLKSHRVAVEAGLAVGKADRVEHEIDSPRVTSTGLLRSSQGFKEGIKITSDKAEPVKVEQPKFDSDKAEPVKVEQPKSDSVKAEPVTVEQPKSDSVKAEPVKAEQPKFDSVKAEPVKVEPVKAEPVKLEPVKAESVVALKEGSVKTSNDKPAVQKLDEGRTLISPEIPPAPVLAAPARALAELAVSPLVQAKQRPLSQGRGSGEDEEILSARRSGSVAESVKMPMPLRDVRFVAATGRNAELSHGSNVSSGLGNSFSLGSDFFRPTLGVEMPARSLENSLASSSSASPVNEAFSKRLRASLSQESLAWLGDASATSTDKTNRSSGLPTEIRDTLRDFASRIVEAMQRERPFQTKLQLDGGMLGQLGIGIDATQNSINVSISGGHEESAGALRQLRQELEGQLRDLGWKDLHVVLEEPKSRQGDLMKDDGEGRRQQRRKEEDATPKLAGDQKGDLAAAGVS